MANTFDPVFGNWYTESRIGTGTDGRVYLIKRKNENGKTERAVLKTIRIGGNRSESRSFNNIGEIESQEKSTLFEDIASDITDNIRAIQKADNGKHFVKYEQWETRQTSDGKGIVILIRLEEMRSLSSLLEEFSFTHEETLRLGVSVCRALARCRDFGYIYPNLKPENILFDRKGVCKLGDFGSFSCLEPSKTSVAFKRTQYYMAPEFITTGNINCTADTYSLGLILYALANRGRLPFVEFYPQEVTINGLDRSKQKRIDGEALARPALASDALFAIIKKACDSDPSKRYLSPKQMLDDLMSALENKPFEKVQYDDIYSVSGKAEPQGETANVKEDTAEKSSDTSYDIYSKQETQEPQVKTPPVSLKDEIQIPDVTPEDYASGDKPKRRRKTSAYVHLPDNTSSKKKNDKDVKKLIIIALEIILLILLLILSLSLRRSASQADTTTQPISAVIETIGGGIPWQLIS